MHNDHVLFDFHRSPHHKQCAHFLRGAAYIRFGGAQLFGITAIDDKAWHEVLAECDKNNDGEVSKSTLLGLSRSHMKLRNAGRPLFSSVDQAVVVYA